MEISTAHRTVRNQATLDLANAGAGASSLRFYAAEGGALLATRTLAAPCGIIVDGRISLQPAPTLELVQVSGSITWATWCDGDGVAIAWGAVTDAAGVGPFRLAGTAGTAVYAGGIVTIAMPALLG